MCRIGLMHVTGYTLFHSEGHFRVAALLIYGLGLHLCGLGSTIAFTAGCRKAGSWWNSFGSVPMFERERADEGVRKGRVSDTSARMHPAANTSSAAHAHWP